MKTITICSHYHSCNYGDKYQSNSLFDKININNTKIIKVNFSKVNKQSYDNNIYDIDYLINNNIFSDYFILTTGSIGNNSPYNLLINKLLNNKLIKQLVIIGGFSCDLLKDELYKIKYMYNNNIIFYARTLNELKLYELIGNHLTDNNITSQYEFKGELIANTILDYLKDIKIDTKIMTKKVGILSLYLFKYCFSSYKTHITNFIHSLDKIILIDTHAGQILIDKYLSDINFKGEIIKTYKTDEIVNNLLDAKVVFSSRLHGGLISILMNIPTYFLPSDNSTNYDIFIPTCKKPLGSFKYHCLSKLNFNTQSTLCKIIKLENICELINSNNYYTPNNDIISIYKKKCKDLENIILNIINS